MAIKFGTDGWRGIIADDFTMENISRVSIATGRYFKNRESMYRVPQVPVTFFREGMGNQQARTGRRGS